MALSTISGTTGITDATITSAKLADFTAAVDLNGVELILDADQDTTITADTDDRIEISPISPARELKVVLSVSIVSVVATDLSAICYPNAIQFTM